MPVDRRMRRKAEELRRAGLEYIQADRWSAVHQESAEPVLVPDVTSVTVPVPSIESPPEVKPKANTSQPRIGHSGPVLSTEEKAKALRVLAEEVAGCTRCSSLASSRTQTVFSDGRPGAELCFVGEAPGADEDAQGVPFVGRAGQLLTKIIEACGLSREEVYICNVIKCRPPENRNPLPDEISNCRPFLERQLEILQPKMMVALGKFAAAHLLMMRPEDVPITKMRGQIKEYCGIPFMITLHPAYLLRNPSAKRDVWEDMKVVMRELGRPIE